MLLPSLAPGLSCFPFIAEYLGEGPLAYAALMDVGNKFFVLILLYLLAMRWYFQINGSTKNSKSDDLRKMVMKMLSEPINLIMIAALILLSLGVNLSELPPLISSTFLRLSGIMAPLILLFIGLAVKVKGHQITTILRLLSIRSGLLFLASALIIVLFPKLSSTIMLLAVVFPQSSCSFWPFAHISLIDGQENNQRKTFDLGFALALLAFSLPFSSIFIMGILSFPTIGINPTILSSIGISLISISLLPSLIGMMKKSFIKGHSGMSEPDGQYI